MNYKRQRLAIVERENPLRKLAVSKAGPGVVGIITHNVPLEMIKSLPNYRPVLPPPKSYAFVASGIIIESQSSPDNTSYISTLLAPASLFKPYPPAVDVDVDVIMANSIVSNGVKLLASDFHYNLAALTIISDSPLPTVTLKRISDVVPIHPIQYDLHQQQLQLQLRPRSDLFKLGFGTPFFTVNRLHSHPFTLFPGGGTFCSKSVTLTRTRSKTTCTCNELLYIEGTLLGHIGGPILNRFGEVIGILSAETLCMPSNLIIRWWSSYKSSGKFRRPFIGLEVTNLVDADIDLLSDFMLKFPNISSAVIVTTVLENSPADCAGIKTNDVITRLDGKLVQSKTEFYDSIWDAENAVLINISRASTEEELNLSVTIEEANPEKFYQWEYPRWKELW